MRNCEKNICPNTQCFGCAIPGPKGPIGPTGPTGSTGPTGPEAILAYGGLYNDTIQTITIAPGSTQTVALEESMVSNNVILGTNNITIEIAGDYRVEFFVLLQSTTGTFGIDVGAQINGVFSELSLFTSTVLTSDFEIITLSGIVNLEVGDILTLALSSATGGSVLFGPSTSANLSVMRLGN